MCLSTGVICDEKINGHLAKEVGEASIESIIGGDFDFDHGKFKRTNRVKPMKSLTCGSCAIRIYDEE